MYSFDTRVRYSDITTDLTISTEGIIDLLQDCATFHSEDRGFTCAKLSEMHRGWFVTDYQIHIKRLPVMGERLTVETFPYGIRGMMASRYYKIKSESGLLITANSMWVLMDNVEIRPVRVSDELKEAYGDCGKPDEEFENRKVPVLDGLEEVGKVRVDTSMLDSNNHVNNGRYIALAERFMDCRPTSGSLRIEYKKAALEGDVLHIRSGSVGADHQVIMTAEDESDHYFKLLYTEDKA